MADVYVFLANGFEEIEALTVVDILRRGGIATETVSVTGRLELVGSHNIGVTADRVFEERKLEDGKMLVLPGGMPGTNALMAHEGLRDLLFVYRDAQKWLTAICAAPSVLGMNGLLKQTQATCYPGFEDKLLGAKHCKRPVVQDGIVVTADGMGSAIPFALALLEVLTDAKTAKEIAEKIQYRDYKPLPRE